MIFRNALKFTYEEALQSFKIYFTRFKLKELEVTYIQGVPKEMFPCLRCYNCQAQVQVQGQVQVRSQVRSKRSKD